MALAALLVVIYPCFPTSVNAATYCVDNTVSTLCSNATGACWTDPFPDIGCAFGTAVSGDTITVRDNGKTNPHAGFNMVDGITVQAENVGVNYPYVNGTVTFPDGLTTAGTVLDGFQIVASLSVYMNAISAAGINNNVIMQNCIIGEAGVGNESANPGITHQGGTPQILNNEFVNKEGPGILIMGPAGWDGASGQAMIIKGNNFHDNGYGGVANNRYPEIHFETSSDARYVLIQDNLIHDNASPVGAAGISVDENGDDTIYITGNEIYNNDHEGFRLETYSDNTGATHTGRITFSGEANFRFPPSNTSANYTDGAPNKIYSNSRGGISTGAGCTMDIISNEIYNNGWGGIGTGFEEPISGSYTWPQTGSTDSAVLTIRKNKIYGNGTSIDVAGGGINAMYASGVILNNVVYENKYAGIRVGDGVGGSHVTNISHNTVVDNGGGTTPDQAVAGGGIVYHDGYASDGTTPCYYCQPHGTNPNVITVKDNVIAYTAKAALIGNGFTNTLGSEERDYNLIYSNNPGAWWWTADCGYVAAGGDYSTEQIDFKCINGQYGFQPLYWDCWQCPEGQTLKTQDPNDILDDPLFTDRVNDDYTLTLSSPGSECASDESSSGACDGSDRGAWGGTGTFSTPYGSGYSVSMDW